MKLKDLTKGDRFRLPNDEREYICTHPHEDGENNIRAEHSDFRQCVWLPSDWECEKVEDSEYVKRIERLREKMELNGYDGKDPLLPYSIDAFYREDEGLFTRDDMVKLLTMYALRTNKAIRPDNELGIGSCITDFLKSRKK